MAEIIKNLRSNHSIAYYHLFFNLTTRSKRFIGPEETIRSKILAGTHREWIWFELTRNF